MGMQYTTEVLHRQSGELVSLDLGVYLTVTELGRSLGQTPRRIRKVLHVLGLAAPEGARGNYRLTFEAVRKGYGKRIDRPKRGRYAFDVISPAGQKVVADNLSQALTEIERQRVPSARGMSEALETYRAHRAAARLSGLTLQGEVCWLADHFPYASAEEIAAATEGAAGKVRKYVGIRRRAVERASSSRQLGLYSLKTTPLPPPV